MAERPTAAEAFKQLEAEIGRGLAIENTALIAPTPAMPNGGILLGPFASAVMIYLRVIAVSAIAIAQNTRKERAS